MRLLLQCILVLVCIVSKSNAELRFCHHGPHRVKDNECPGGILFFQKIQPKCMFFASDGHRRNIAPTYNEGLCVESGPDGYITSDADRSGPQIQRINMSKAPRAPAGDLSTDDCIQECLADVLLPPVHEHFDEDLPVRNVTEETIISERLFDYLVEGEDDDQRGTPGQNIVKMFKEAMLVTQKHCGDPWVSPRFREVSEYVVRWMLTRLHSGDAPDVNPHEHEVIMKILQRCKTVNKQPFIIAGTHCANNARIHSITVQNKKKQMVRKTYELQPKSYRWGKFEPFIEAAWAHIDFVRSYCFQDFLPRLNHLHLFQQYMESLFKEVIQRRWANPPVFKRSDNYWNVLAQVRDLNITMRNLDFCAQAAVEYSPFKQRLDRPFSTPIKEDRDTVMGWTDANSYWEHYEARGGFQAEIRRFGICAQTRKEATRFPAAQGVTCTPKARALTPDFGEMPPMDDETPMEDPDK